MTDIGIYAIQDNSYQNFIVNHSYNFADPSIHDHTQNIEKLGGSTKWTSKVLRGTSRYLFWGIYVEEYS